MHRKSNDNFGAEVVGLIPAAGKASRLPRLPCSKELYPIGYQRGNYIPKVVSHYLLENMRSAGIRKAFIILRKGKWDIPAYFGDGKILDMHLGYLLMDVTYGVPFTLDQAYSFVKENIVALGFPDIIYEPKGGFAALLDKQKKSNADIVLGLFKTGNPCKSDMVDFDDKGRIRSIQIKPSRTDLKYSWGIAVWRPSFTKFMHDYALSELNFYESGSQDQLKRELFVGDVIQEGIRNNMRTDTVIFRDGTYIDIGTPEDLARAVEMNRKV